MRKLALTLHTYFETKSGLVVLTFIMTTLVGSVLTGVIETLSSRYEHNFEMYKTRLSEAKSLQKVLLTEANTRAFYLDQVLGKLSHPEEYPRQEVKDFWKAHVTPAKDEWNKDLYYFYAQTRVLFSPTLSNMLVNEDNEPVHDTVIQKLDPTFYQRTIPKTLHRALADAHATLHYWLFKCNASPLEKCDAKRFKDLEELATKQMMYLNLMENCFGYRVSAELLRYPDGPRKQHIIDMPFECPPFA